MKRLLMMDPEHGAEEDEDEDSDRGFGDGIGMGSATLLSSPGNLEVHGEDNEIEDGRADPIERKNTDRDCE